MDNKNKDLQNNQSFDLNQMSTHYKTHRFKKKKHGIAGFFQKIGGGIASWWRRLKKWEKITLSTLVSVVAVFLAAVIFLLNYFDYNYNEITKKPSDLGFENVINEKVINVALFGIDTRKDSFSGNSDSIMVLSINTEKKTVKIVSIMRDSLVAIERNGKTSYRKINSAYALGGPELAIKTINQNFGLDISEYGTVNFYGMADIIDAVGGIDAELTKGEVTSASASKYGLNGVIKSMCKSLKVDPKPHYITTPGKHHLNGIQAVAYSRIRRFSNVWGTNNDFGRTDRQRYVMEELFNKALTMDKTQYVKLAKALIPCTQTSLSYTEIMGLAVDILLESPTFEQSRMPLSEYQMKAPYIPRVGSTVYYDLEFAKDVLHAFFYDDITPEEYVEQNGIRKNDWYAQVGGGSYSNSGSSGNSSQGSSSKPSSSQSDATDSSSTDSTSTIPEDTTTTPEGTVTTPEDGTSTSPEGTTTTPEGTTTTPEGTTTTPEGTTTTPQGGSSTPSQGGTSTPSQGGSSSPTQGGTSTPSQGGTTTES